MRLLASADNSFAGFNATGSVELVPGFSHDISSEWGHGFLDVAAALMPIGTTSVASSDGIARSTAEPLLVSSVASGDAVAQALSGVDILAVDSLGASFEIPATSLVGTRMAPALQTDALAGLLLGEVPDFGVDRALYPGAVTLPDLDMNGLSISLSLPTGATPEEAFGLAVGRDFATDFGAVSLTAGVGRDGGILLPTFGGEDLSTLVTTSLAARFDLGGGNALRISSDLAYSDAHGGTQLNGAGLEFHADDPFGSGGSLVLAVSLPTAVTSGRTSIVLPVRAALGGDGFQDFDIDLAPDAREIAFSAGYTVPITSGVDAFAGFEVSGNRGNVAGRSELSALIGIVARF